MSEKCPNCGKEFAVLWPSQWAYKRYSRFLCSWKCLREYDRKEVVPMEAIKRDRAKIADEVIEEIRAGRNPILYLKSLGYGNPSQAYSDIRKMMKKSMPEKFAQLPEDLKAWNRQHAPETPEGNFGGLCPPPENVEIPERKKPEPKPRGPIEKDGLVIRALEGKYGTYQYRPKCGYIDVDLNDGSGEISMEVSDWRLFLAEVRVVADLLGVKL